MGKTLILLRHAKSAWPDDVADHERPLADRGRRDAPAVGRWLRDHDLLPDVAVVSSATRARETYTLAADELPREPPLTVTDEIYHAGTGDLLDVVRQLPDEARSVLLVGHNPSIGMLASLLDDRQNGVLEFKTSAVAVFDIGASWADANPGVARLISSAVPRG